MKRVSRLRLVASWVCCPQCDAIIPISGSAQSLTCESCDTDLHYDGAGKCRTLLRRPDKRSGAAPNSQKPAPA